MEKRKLTKEDIDKVRNIDGFPIGKDEDIIALSDPPYYTACPNPFIEDFIKEHGTPYDEATDDYHREPFASDVSEGKSDKIYNAHSYHTKVPHKAIMRYILHYTEPGDIVFDGFCGTGMTGIATQLSNEKNTSLSRKVILNDISPAATFIASNYNISIDATEFSKDIVDILDKIEKETKWMYETTIPNSNGKKAIINYVIWSEVLICSHCGSEVVFWNVAVDNNKNMLRIIHCENCGAEIEKSKCEKAIDYYIDEKSGKAINITKQVPVLINYFEGKKKFEKKPDNDDLELIKKINASSINNFWFPTNDIPEGVKTSDPIKWGATSVDLFYTKRNILVLSMLWNKALNSKFTNQIRFCLTSVLIKTASKLHNVGLKKGKINLAGAMPNALYIPSIMAERNIIELVRGKIDDILSVYSLNKNNNDFIVSCGSSTDLKFIPDNTIDYIFVDPPFGDNLMYSELSFIWEAWLKVITNNQYEAIINKSQGKGIHEYQSLFIKCFSEFYRCLKPNRWITIEFHNTKNSVWMAINEAIQRAGFIIANVKTLDKGQGSYNQQTALGTVKQDLVIFAYKPKESLVRDFTQNAGTPETAWAFVRQHLSNLTRVVKHNNQIETVAERQAFLLFDRMVAYHIMQGLPVPIDAAEFYKGLDERFLKRDNMYFLPDQVNEYDLARSTCELEKADIALFVTDEKSAIGWLYGQLDEKNGGKRQTYQVLQPKFMQEVKAVKKAEKMPELIVMLEENFLKDENGAWYVPDLAKSGDVAKLREKNLLKEFQEYQATKGKLKVFRSEAIRAGFAKLWKDKDYKAIVALAERLPEETVQEDPNILMYYDISLSRV